MSAVYTTASPSKIITAVIITCSSRLTDPELETRVFFKILIHSSHVKFCEYLLKILETGQS
jgi:hypothetical protein